MKTVSFKPDGTRLTDREVHAGLKLVIVANCMATLFRGFTQAISLTMLFEYLGVSGLMIGVLAAAQQFSSLIQLPAAYLVNRLSERRRFTVKTKLASNALWLSLTLIPLLVRGGNETAAVVIIVVLAISSILGQAACAPWNSWVVDLVPEKERGRFWSLFNCISTIFLLFSTAAAGYLLDWFSPAKASSGGHYTGFVIVFAIGSVAGLVEALLYIWVPEPKPQSTKRVAAFWQSVSEPIKSREFRLFALSGAAWFFSCAILGGFNQIAVKRFYGCTYSHISWWILSGQLGFILSGFFIGYVVDRVGARTFGLITMFAGPLIGVVPWFFIKPDVIGIEALTAGIPGLGWAMAGCASHLPWLAQLHMPQAIWLLIIGAFCCSWAYSGVGVALITLYGEYMPKEGRTMSMAIYFTLIGMSCCLASLFGGKVVDLVDGFNVHWIMPTGAQFHFNHVLLAIHVVIAWLVAIPLLACLPPKRQDLSVATAVSRIFVVNPVRLLSNIFSIYTMGADVTSIRRARAVKEIGENRITIAVNDLVEKLDDPSADVREEAASALGSLGSPEAINALLAELDDPHSDLGPEIARALRQVKDPRSVDPLIRKLSDPDQETRAESARTLGTLGDRRAAAPLLELLQKSSDSKTVSASSEALSRLGELAAIHEILPHLRSTCNPVLRQSLAVAVGDLLGEPEECYRVITREGKRRCCEVDNLLEDLAKDVQEGARDRFESAGRALCERLTKIRGSYEEGTLDVCAVQLFDAAFTLSALAYGVEFGSDAKAAVQDIVWRDQRFGVGFWYLYILRNEWGTKHQDAEIILGIYFLCRQGGQKIKRLRSGESDKTVSTSPPQDFPIFT